LIISSSFHMGKKSVRLSKLAAMIVVTLRED
jgi:hypothetical protein